MPGEELLAIKERLNSVEHRLNNNDDFRTKLKEDFLAVSIEQGVMRTEIKNISVDVAQLGSKIDDRLGSVSKALWAGFCVFLTAFLTIVGFIVAQGGVK